MNKYYKVVIFLFFSAIIIGLVFFIHNYYQYQYDLKLIIAKDIKAIVTKSKEESRGFFNIELENNNGVKIRYSLPQSWFFLKNHIQAQDSVSKEANSKIMTFYKLKDGVYEKC